MQHLKFILINFLSLFLIAGLSSLHAQIEHSSFTKILQQNVTESGFVNYKQLKKDEKKLDRYLDVLSDNTPKSNWTKNEKMAYLINTYNAYTLKLILDNYPVESIKDIGGLFSSPFTTDFIPFTTDFIPFNGERISLDDVEKGMLLEMNDPRVHFAINCASESCPKLQNEAFEAKHLDKQLDETTKEFILSKENKITKNQLQLSKIFKWYASDFENAAGSIIEFINPYISVHISDNASISFKDYSWKLNGK
ncbi:DUF547 domain-containing protein [Psychroflexus planctonicus]|nr:DUF547 domain-containing protein [Psychroflexus planctonicus]